MTDREQFEKWWDGYFHEINGQKETAQAAWLARGAEIKQLNLEKDGEVRDLMNIIQKLTAKLDKAIEALNEKNCE